MRTFNYKITATPNTFLMKKKKILSNQKVFILIGISFGNTFGRGPSYMLREIDKKYREELVSYKAGRTAKEYWRYHSKMGGFENISKASVKEFLKLNYNNVAFAYVKSALAFYEENEELFDLDLRAKLDLVKIPKMKGNKKQKEPTYISEEELELLAKSMPEEKHRILLYCLFYTGLRWSEVFQITPNDFDFNDWVQRKGHENQSMGILRVPASIAKGKKSRTISVMPKAMYLIMNYCNYRLSKERKFTHDSRIFDFGKTDWSVLLRETAQRVLKKHITTHSLRHSFATLLVKRGIPIEKVQLLLGHSNIGTTQIYFHLNFEDVNQAMEKTFLSSHSQSHQPSDSPTEKRTGSILKFLP